MTRKRKRQSAEAQPEMAQEIYPDPVDISDGIPDRCERVKAWKYLAMAAVFAGWVAFLIYCAVAGNP
jgi:hypothetical protein